MRIVNGEIYCNCGRKVTRIELREFYLRCTKCGIINDSRDLKKCE